MLLLLPGSEAADPEHASPAEPQPVWKICLGQLGGNRQEAEEIAGLLQEVSSSIQVTGVLTRTLTARTSTSSGNPTHLSTKERIRRAVPLQIDAGSVPWSQLVAVVSSADLQTPSSPTAARQQQVVLEVNSGGAVFFLFFKLMPEQHQQQHQQHQQQIKQQQPGLPLLQLHRQQATAREGVVVLKVGASRLAMQAEQFANELTRHLAIAAPDCRIVRQVGPTAAEFSAAQAAVQQLAEPPQPRTMQAAAHTAATGASSHAAASTASVQMAAAAAGSAVGCEVACELLAELQHLPCFLLMEFVEGAKLSDCPHALDPAVSDAGQLCEDVGRLFLLDMLLGNADRMPCPELGWRGNPNNLLYAQPGCRHAGRAVAIDSCVARRPPALKASAEDAAVERLSQLVLAVPGVSAALLQQLLGGLRQKQQQQQQCRHQQQQGREQLLPGAVGLCSQLSIESWGTSSSGQAQTGPVQPHFSLTSSQTAAASHASTQQLELQQPEQQGARLGSNEAFTPEEVARFQTGLRHCLDGVLQIKGLLEMVSAKIAEWIAEFVEDVVRLNPGFLLTQHPASPSPASLMRSPKPSPRASARGSFTSIRLEPSAPAHAAPLPLSASSSLGGMQEPTAAVAAAASAGGGGAASAGGVGIASGSSLSSRLQAVGVAGSAASAVAADPPASAAATADDAAQAAASPPPVPVVGTPPKGLFKQFVGGSKATKGPQPQQSPLLTRRFAAIKAAICPPSSHGTNTTSAASSHRDVPEQQPQQQGQPEGDSTASGVCAANSLQPGGAAQDHNQSGSDNADTSSNNPCSPDRSSTCGESVTSHSVTTPPPMSRRHHSLSLSDHHTPASAARPPSSELATAVVAAALSPRASASQAEALVGLFASRTSSTGGRLHRSLNGSVRHAAGASGGGGGRAVSSSSACEWWDAAAAASGSGGLRPPCARRVTWTAADDPNVAGVVLDFGGGENQASASVSTSSNGKLEGGGGGLLKALGGTSVLEQFDIKPAELVSSSGGGSSSGSMPVGDAIPAPPAGWAAAPPPATAAVTPPAPRSQHADTTTSSSDGNSSASTSPFAARSAQRDSSGSSRMRLHLPPPTVSASMSPPPPAGAHFDSFLHRQINTRHLSFTNSGGGGGGGSGGDSIATSPAAGMQRAHQHQQQHRSSTSSLQVLASLQLDATLASINQEARHDGVLAERLVQWKARFREKGAELSAAIAEWQQRHQLAAVLSTGFLDGSHPIVDAYELGVRLQHMLRRLTALAAGALVQVPIAVLPGVFLGNAVAADSHHLLQYLGVTHVLNAAQELQLTPDPGMFDVLRVAIRDEEEEDVAEHFELARRWIDTALSSGGAVLVHCHEGKSRSVTLLLAYLMMQQGMSLAEALQHMRAVHPKASPNAGFMSQLMRLDQQLYGRCSIKRSELPRSKPEARICSICGAAAGISYESLVRHTKAKHGLPKPPAAAATTTTAATMTTAASAQE